MPKTWTDIQKQMGWAAAISRFEPKYAIEGGARYQAQQRRAWGAAGRSSTQRNELGQASYNAGLGNILKAQKACKDAVLWEDIQPCLPGVTGPEMAKQTTDYVKRIRTWMLRITAGLL